MFRALTHHIKIDPARLSEMIAVGVITILEIAVIVMATAIAIWTGEWVVPAVLLGAVVFAAVTSIRIRP